MLKSQTICGFGRWSIDCEIVQAMSEALGRERCLSVVVPAYNEEATIAAVIRRLVPVPNLLEIVVVDDGSRDRTYQIAIELGRQYPEVRVLRQPRNAGKTAALKAGFAATRGDIVLVQDADLEYDPSEIPELIHPILRSE